MVGFIKKILKISAVAMIVPAVAFAAQAPNPRGANARNSSSVQKTEAEQSASIRRSATSVIARSVWNNGRNKAKTVVTARSTTNRSGTGVSRTARRSRVVSNGTGVARSATKQKSLARSATKANTARSGANMMNVARSARATAVFNDVSKIGGGYAECRDSYATCMDQMCANANDTYRRCFCSDRFTSFRDTADALDTALQMLADFQDNNLNAVDKTAAEVGAMYSASEGEAAIKRDTSASQKLLDNIGDILSGKKTATKKNTNSNSLGVLDLSGFSSGFDDVWGGSGGSSIFGGGDTGSNMAELEGKELYTSANKQCAEVTRQACSSDAMFNLAKSAYSIMITQDCNAYEKNINAKKESVQETVRTAEKYLREARLEEYRAHNSQDVNDCLAKVEAAIRQPTACGEDYDKCLDYTGLYINAVTGEPIYSQALFDLNNLIKLDRTSDVLGANADFDKFLDERKMFATTALDSCRSIADTVWYEFKRTALIQIAQAQDEKIEEVKASCVDTMKECYDTQTGALEDFGGDAAISTGAISAITAHNMCKEKVLACAALYGKPNACKYNDETKTIEDSGNGTCGLKSLLAYVNSVDSAKIAKGCEESLREYAQELCAPSSGDTTHSYPWGCRLRAPGNAGDYDPKTNNAPTTIYGMLEQRASVFCADDLKTTTENLANADVRFNVDSAPVVANIIADIKSDMGLMLASECRSITTEGTLIWDERGYTVDAVDKIINVSPGWLNKVFGNGADLQSLINTGVHGYEVHTTAGRVLKNSEPTSFGWGVCMMPTERQLCKMQIQLPGMEGTAEYKENKCVLTDDWYKKKCEGLDGYWTGSVCYIK